MSVILSVVCFDKAQHRLKLANLIKVPELVEGSNEKKSCIDAGFFRCLNKIVYLIAASSVFNLSAIVFQSPAAISFGS